MKKRQQTVHRATALLAATITFMFAVMGSFSLFSANTFLVLATSFALAGTVFFLFEAAAGADDKSVVMKEKLSRILAGLILLTVIFGTWFAIQSLWVGAFETDRNKFALENTATGATIAAAVLTLLLSTLQRDVYWMTKRKPGSLDERETYERRQVFEKSYKFGAFISIVTIWGYLGNLDAVQRIKAFNSASQLPGHYFIPAYCLVISLFALPLIVATWKKR